MLLLILTIISANAVFASDNNTDVSLTDNDESNTLTVSEVQENELTASEGNENTTSDTNYFTDLAELIDSGSETITLTQDYIYNETVDEDYVDGIVIDESITIDGNGYTINATDLARIFNVTADNVIIKNVVFTDAYTNTGNGQGACVLWNGDDGELINCTFTDSYAKIGGAVLWFGDDGLVDECNFTNNNAMTTAAAIYWNGANGRINNSYFTKNHVTTKGGAVYSSYNDNITIENCVFDSNYASLWAGAVAFDYASGNLINCTFEGNYLVWSLNGGAIQFTGNSSNLFTLTDCTFDSNKAGTGSSIYSTIPLVIEDSTFSDAASSKTIVTTSNLTLSGNTLNNNNTIYVNGGQVLSPTSVVIMDGESINADAGDVITLTGNVYDDNNNPIILKSIAFIVNDNETVTATFASNGTFSAEYTVGNETEYIISADVTDTLAEAVIYPTTVTTESIPEISIEVLYATEPVTVIKVSSDVNGTYTVTVGNESEEIEIDENAYLVYYLDKGEHNITVSYAGDEKYTNTTQTLTFTVKGEDEDKTDSKISISLVTGDCDVEGTLTDTDGNAIADAEITYNVDGADNTTVTTDSEGVFAFNTGSNGLVTIYYAGDDTYSESTASITLENLSPAKSTPSVTISDIVDFEIGKNYTVTISVPEASGNVTVYYDGTANIIELEDSQATYVIDEITSGVHSIVAVYNGDDEYESATNSTSFYAEIYSTQFANLTVSSDLVITGVLVNSLGDALNNTAMSYTIGTTTGNITTADDGSFIIAASTGDTVTITYEGDNMYDGTNIALTLMQTASSRLGSQFNVTEGQSIETYAVDNTVGERGTPLPFLLTDSNGNPIANATVQFAYKTSIFNRTTDANGYVYLTVGTQVSDYYLCALSYLGDATHNATFVAFNFHVVKKPITITASAKTYSASATKKYTVTLKTAKCASRDGNVYLKSGKKVTLKINGVTYTAKTDDSGKATFTLKVTKRGVFTAKITFAGDKTYEAATKTVKITIK